MDSSLDLVMFKKILDNQLNSFIVLNMDKKVVYANKKAKDLFGENLALFLGNYLSCTNTLLNNADCQTMEICSNCIVNKAISNVILSGKEQLLEDVDYDINHKITKISMKISLIDSYIILEIHNLNVDLKKSIFLSKLAETSVDLIAFKDINLVYEYANKSFLEFASKNYNEIIGRKDSEIFDDESLCEQCLASDLMTIEKGKYTAIEVIGDTYYRVNKQLLEGGILISAKNINEEMLLSSEIDKDPLTGIFNRRCFMKYIDEIYEKQLEDYYLIVIDLDDLRLLNNQYGHLTGDHYLCKLAEVLTNNAEGLFFRLGGDEFTGLIQGDLARVEKVMNNIFEDLSNTNYVPKLSISIGITKLDLKHSYLENFKKADALLYKVKQTGKADYIIE